MSTLASPSRKRIVLVNILFTLIALSCTFFIISMLITLLFNREIIFHNQGHSLLPFLKAITPTYLTYSFIAGFIFGIPLALVRMLSQSTKDYARKQKLGIE